MYKHLYDNFAHWYHGGQIYFYSDPHFADEDMKHLRDNYIGDAEQVKRINKTVTDKDTLILLGDIGEIKYLKQLKGYKILVLGNHDKGASRYKDYVNEVYEGPLFISKKILISHEPIDFPYGLNIHGHMHRQKIIDNCHLNMCAEFIDYTPVCFKKIINSGVLRNIRDIHKTTILDRLEQE